MVSTASLRPALLVLVASAVAVSALPGLSLKVTGAALVDGVDNLKLVATVVNTGDETLKLLNDPRGPLSKLLTQTFVVSHDESGAAPEFTGAKAKYVPSYVVKHGGADAFTVLAPGESASVEHDLSKAYDFTRPGVGKYTFAAASLFHYVDPTDGTLVALRAAQPVVHTASLRGKLASPRTVLAKRATFEGCSDTQQSALVAAAEAAQGYAAETYQYTQSLNATSSESPPSSPRYATWFGAPSFRRYAVVSSHFSSLNENTFAEYTYDCSSCTESDAFAYVFPNDFGKVYLCGAFWNAPVSGADSQAGTIIHESSHFTQNGGTEDIAYGQEAAQALARDDPNEAVKNADSHEYYAENTPALE